MGRMASGWSGIPIRAAEGAPGKHAAGYGEEKQASEEEAGK